MLKKNRVCHFMQIISIRDNLLEISNPVFWGKIKTNFIELASAEFALRMQIVKFDHVFMFLLPVFLSLSLSVSLSLSLSLSLSVMFLI